MNKVSYNILPSPETNDHEVRILIDNEDILGNDYLGIDPPDYFNQDNLGKGGEIMIGRCTCGVEGCCDYPVNVSVNENTVSWTNVYGLNLLFDKREYTNSITDAKNDHSWEDIKRRVERLTTDILKYSHTKDNFHFNWASARIKNGQITLSYFKNGQQKCFDIAWDGQTDTNVKQNAERFLKEILHRE